ncbi:uncharacterized protein [Miscanthus floridulus]|uniref:uncharacterized protein isoform X1 n=1 Tax=Miscanthus floridulus TaxID=154761 RepID=UPI003457F299
MATLTLPPTNNAAGKAATQQSLAEKPAKDAADPGGMESEWVVLGKSDIVPADVAAAAAAGHRRLNFSPLPMIPIWWEVVDGDSNSAIGRVSLFRFETKAYKLTFFLAQGADGSWGRGLHGLAVLQEGEEGRRRNVSQCRNCSGGRGACC